MVFRPAGRYLIETKTEPIAKTEPIVMKKHPFLFSIAMICLIQFSAMGQISGIVGYQGKVTVSGTNYTGNGQFKFALVNTAGNITYWSHNGLSEKGMEPSGTAILLPVEHGVFSINLGDTNIANMLQRIPNQVFAAGDVFLRVWFNDGVNGFEQFKPDRRITSAPYAMVAGYYAEADPVFAASPAGSINYPDIVNWNNAFNWGNPANRGYLTNFTETDPIWKAAEPGYYKVDGSRPMTGALNMGGQSITNIGTKSLVFSDGTVLGASNFQTWNTAYQWGNHATNGYLTPASADVRYAMAANVYSKAQSDAKYLTGYTETDPVFEASPAFDITGAAITKWNAAASWGNHATNGYLTRFTETDPVWTAAEPGYFKVDGSRPMTGALNMGGQSITNISTNSLVFADGTILGVTDVQAWNTAYQWGNHATNGYLTPASADVRYPLAANVYSKAQSDAKYLTGYTETDPVFESSPAFDITGVAITKWNAAASWGNHATNGYLTRFTETDPVWTAAEPGYYKVDGSRPMTGALNMGGQSITNISTNSLVFSDGTVLGATNVQAWNTAYQWGNHATNGYLTPASADVRYPLAANVYSKAQSDAKYLAGYTETDPVFEASPAFDITGAAITKWNAAASWGNHATNGYLTSFTETDPVWTAAEPGYYKVDGSRPMIGALNMGGQSITNISTNSLVFLRWNRPGSYKCPGLEYGLSMGEPRHQWISDSSQRRCAICANSEYLYQNPV